MTPLLTTLRARLAKKLHTQLSSDFERFIITFRQNKGENFMTKRVEEHKNLLSEPVLAPLMLRNRVDDPS